MTAPEWRERAACADGDPQTAAMFFCDGYTWDNTHNRSRAADAKAICARCPVQAECRAWALATGLPYAIAAGLTDTERHERRPCESCRAAATLDRQLRKEAAA